MRGRVFLENHREDIELDLTEFDQPGIIAKNAAIVLLKNNLKRIKENENIYYDKEKDAQFMKKYYRKLNLHGKGKNVFYSLHSYLKKTHKNIIPYFLSKDMYLYTWVDLQPDGTMKSIYSGKINDPDTFLLDDFMTVNERYEKFQELNHLYLNKHEMLKRVKSIDYESKFNTEHIVPQSWFNAAEPMKGDLHHLFVCQPDCNTLRSNLPYGDHAFYNPESETEPIRNHCGVASGEYFEPEYGKGTVARAMLYFFVRYPDAIKKSIMKKIHIPVLLKWNQDFPVTVYEKHRNLAIYEIQGNRNPFIDFPELADVIWP